MNTAYIARITTKFIFVALCLTSINCVSGGDGSWSEHEGDASAAKNGSGGTTGAADTSTIIPTKTTCPLYQGYICDPTNPYGDGCNEAGYKCLYVETKNTHVGTDAPWRGTYACIRQECQACDKECAFTLNDAAATVDKGILCKFSFCGSDNQGNGGNAGYSGTGGTSGGPTISQPPVNCSSYSFRGCSQVGSATFSSNCIRAGCRFSLDSCKTSGDFDSPTCDCNCS